MKTGLVLEGGAMRGLFSAGVMDVLMEHQIAFDGAIGVSAGAAFGCNYKSRQPGRVIRYNTEYARDPRYCSLRSLSKREICLEQISAIMSFRINWIHLTQKHSSKIQWNFMSSARMS